MKSIFQTAVIFVIAVAASTSAFPSSADDINLDSKPHGYIGLEGGPSIHTGRTHVVDGLTGATSQDTTGDWRKFRATSGLVLDMGLPTSHRGLDGTLGLRLTGNASFPGPYYGINILARYRFSFKTNLKKLFSVEPWAGAGLGFHFIDNFSSDTYIVIPVAAGCDFQLFVPNLYFTTHLEMNTLNPMGPSYSETLHDREMFYKPRYDSYMMKAGVAWRFY